MELNEAGITPRMGASFICRTHGHLHEFLPCPVPQHPDDPTRTDAEFCARGVRDDYFAVTWTRGLPIRGYKRVYDSTHGDAMWLPFPINPTREVTGVPLDGDEADCSGCGVVTRAFDGSALCFDCLCLTIPEGADDAELGGIAWT